jgi:hypothetical protein
MSFPEVESLAAVPSMSEVLPRARSYLSKEKVDLRQVARTMRDYLQVIRRGPIAYEIDDDTETSSTHRVVNEEPPCAYCDAMTVFFCDRTGLECREFKHYVKYGKTRMPEGLIQEVEAYLRLTPSEQKEMRRKHKGLDCSQLSLF